MAEIKLDWGLDPIERLKAEIENEKVERNGLNNEKK